MGTSLRGFSGRMEALSVDSVLQAVRGCLWGSKCPGAVCVCVCVVCVYVVCVCVCEHMCVCYVLCMLCVLCMCGVCVCSVFCVYVWYLSCVLRVVCYGHHSSHLVELWGESRNRTQRWFRAFFCWEAGQPSDCNSRPFCKVKVSAVLVINLQPHQARVNVSSVPNRL